MELQPYPLRLEQYFFVHQEVRANPEFDGNGRKDGSKVLIEVNASPIDGREGAYTIDAILSIDENISENPAYFFRVHAVGKLCASGELPEENARNLAAQTGANILLGAIRERLAEMTSRGPWGAFMMPPVLLINILDAAQSDP